jgi:hypothetical protein
MDWNDMADGSLPPTKRDTMMTWRVSAKNEHGDCDVTFASYGEGVWRDTDLREIEVYALCQPIPAAERT